MRPANLKSKIFLDSSDPAETREIIAKLGFLDGQTTNPSLFAKNPAVQERMKMGEKFSSSEVYEAYKKIVQEISTLLPQGSVSTEVYADANTPIEKIISQAREMNAWIPNAHIKLPVTKTCLEAAEILAKEGMRLNMTLVFSQEQAGAVYSATKGAEKGQIYLSPFIGRLDDKGEDGMSLIKNILNMYENSDQHVEVLSASVRTYSHFLRCLQLKSDIITAPYKVLLEWTKNDLYIPGEDWRYDVVNLRSLPYEEVPLEKNWRDYNIQHDLADQGLAKFVIDWNTLVKS